ncbi:pentatricopeptide repeat-containing protein At3g16610-like isoform X1 [Mercurialis annua]|uniref:pentatricopeptide repeat-containing protein At3g16610-like isoform X1 n=1 Tax=Mercurialis annua TaxID=3986 RepID=UPI00215F4BB4|nr:pentatricopeptide repeat-containing protein At3g16610-like isoform X1 [Mercurialis annua]
MAHHPHLLNFLSLCKTPNHLKSFKSLLIIHGLINHKLLLVDLLKSCFHLGASNLALSIFNSIKKPTLFLQNLVIRGLSNHGLHDHVLSVFIKCRDLSCPYDNFTFPFVIKACSVVSDFGILKKIHCVVLRNGYEQNVVVGTCLVDFYAKNGVLESARVVFDEIPQPDLVTWNALISGYSFHGCNYEVFEIFKRVFEVGLKPNLSSLASVIPVCTHSGCFDFGRSLHGFAVKFGLFADDFLVPALISLYANASDVYFSDATKLFEAVWDKNDAVWNAMISAYTHNHMPLEAFEMFREMQDSGLRPNLVTFVSVTPSCELIGSVWFGESLHACAIKHGSKNHTSMLTALVSMYAKLGEIRKARYLFDSNPNKNLLSWNVMVSGYVYNNMWDECLGTFCEMQLGGLIPDAWTIVSVVSVCTKLEAVSLGKSAHAFCIRRGFNSNINVSNALLAFYSDCSHFAYSLKLFHNMDTRDLLSWNTLISKFVQIGEAEKAAELFHQLQKDGLALDVVTLLSILPMFCGNENQGHLGQGMSFHGYAIKKGVSTDVSLVNALISMYCKCGDLDAGKLLFEAMPKRCIISWNSLIGGFRHHNLQYEALIIFRQMIKESQRPNSITMLHLLPLCFSQFHGMSIHAFAIRSGFIEETPLLTSLMFMYARFETMKLCLLLFETNKTRDISLWNAIISVHLQASGADKVVALFCDLLRIGLQKPDRITILSLISACVHLKNLKLAICVMTFIVHKGFDKDIAISNALIDLFAKCGNVIDARQIFEALPAKDSVSWSVMINGYGLHGDGEAALELFRQMQFSGVKPDDVTFLSILSACSHSGLVEKGWMIFNSMVEQGMLMKMEHYACMVDLLGRTGHLGEAYEMVKKLPCEPSISLLESLLGACKNYSDIELGEKISAMLSILDSENSGSYVVLSNIYAAAGRWTDADRVRSHIEGKRLRKICGLSFVTEGV